VNHESKSQLNWDADAPITGLLSYALGNTVNGPTAVVKG
jgi:hypothetical protein